MIGAIIQARSSSVRLPNKVLKNIGDSSMLEYQISRLKKSKKLDCIIVATSSHINDDVIADMAHSQGVKVFRGSLHDVLSRYHDCCFDMSIIAFYHRFPLVNVFF